MYLDGCSVIHILREGNKFNAASFLPKRRLVQDWVFIKFYLGRINFLEWKFISDLVLFILTNGISSTWSNGASLYFPCMDFEKHPFTSVFWKSMILSYILHTTEKTVISCYSFESSYFHEYSFERLTPIPGKFTHADYNHNKLINDISRNWHVSPVYDTVWSAS